MGESEANYTAFIGHIRVATGSLAEVVTATKLAHDRGETERIALFDDRSGRVIDVDYRGSEQQVIARLAEHPMLPRREQEALKPRKPGRPRLGVVAREVTLLPRHWEWLTGQRGGASATLRRLVEQASRASRSADLAREAQEAVHRFMWDMAAELTDFEEVSRAFFAKDYDELCERIMNWPADIADHVQSLVARLQQLESELQDPCPSPR